MFDMQDFSVDFFLMVLHFFRLTGVEDAFLSTKQQQEGKKCAAEIIYEYGNNHLIPPQDRGENVRIVTMILTVSRVINN